MATKLITAPTEEALTLDEVRDHLRIEDTIDDARLQGIIKAARLAFEGYCNRALISSTWDLYLDAFLDQIDLPAPVTSITSIKYYDTANVQQTLSSSYYVLDPVSEPARLMLAYGYSWPSIYDRPGCVIVRYVSGHTTAADVPEDVKIGLLWWCEAIFDDRPDMEDRARQMWAPYRWWPV